MKNSPKENASKSSTKPAEKKTEPKLIKSSKSKSNSTSKHNNESDHSYADKSIALGGSRGVKVQLLFLIVVLLKLNSHFE